MLNYGWDEWEALPWYQRRAYIEGLSREMSGENVHEPQTEAEEKAALAEMGINFN